MFDMRGCFPSFAKLQFSRQCVGVRRTSCSERVKSSKRRSQKIAAAARDGFVIEQITAHLPQGATASFYRTAAGAELDMVVEVGRKELGFEIKFASAPKVTKGFRQARVDVGVDQAYIVAPVRERYPFAKQVEVLPVPDLPGVRAESDARYARRAPRSTPPSDRTWRGCRHA